MNVAFMSPFALAWQRMKRLLFTPFDLRVWIVLGFAAFLAGLDSGCSVNLPVGNDEAEIEALTDEARDLFDSPAIIPLVVVLIVFVLALCLLFLWLASRAKFVFLDGVVHERAAIVEPWSRYRLQGNSLFLWTLAFAVIAIAVLICLLGPVIWILRLGDEPTLLAIIGLLLLVLAFALAVGYVTCFLHNFVVPLMYRDGSTTMAAWRKFLPLFRSDPASFLVYGLFVFALAIVVVAAVVTAGLATCCCGFILLAIPYVGSVFLLPVSVTYRGFGPEFLAQYGPDFSIFPARPSDPAGPPPSPRPSPLDSPPDSAALPTPDAPPSMPPAGGDV